MRLPPHAALAALAKHTSGRIIVRSVRSKERQKIMEE